MSRRKKNAGTGYGMQFHGAFGSKQEAKKKERAVHGFIQPRNIRGERRYVVMSERKNPRRRKKNPVLFDPQLNAYSAWERTKKWGTVYGQGSTQREATRDLNERLAAYRKGEKPGAMKGYGGHNRHHRNPMDEFGARHLDQWIESQYPIGSRYEDEGAELRPKMIALYEEDPEFWGGQGYPNWVQHIQRKNPMDLVVMGANPRRRNASREVVVHPGETITLKVNPSAAEEIREEFTGREADQVDVYDEPHMQAGSYSKLGDLMGITYKPVGGGQVQAIGWYEGSERIPLHEAAKTLRRLTEAPVLVSATNRRQLYFVSGNQDVSPLGLEELGEARTIVYRERKHFDDFALINYQHNFGEENGKRPTLFYDAGKKRLLLEGGDYEVRPEGITN